METGLVPLPSPPWRGHGPVRAVQSGDLNPQLVFWVPSGPPGLWPGAGGGVLGPLRLWHPHLRPGRDPPATFPSDWILSSSFLRSSCCCACQSPVSICKSHYGPCSRPDVSWPPGPPGPQKPPTCACPMPWTQTGLSHWPVRIADLPQR